MRFEFATATRILFGPGVLDEVGRLARPFGARALVVTGKAGRHTEAVIERVEAEGGSCWRFRVAAEPTTEDIDSGVKEAREAACDHVIAVGGGSAIDAGKAIAALLTNEAELIEYLEVIGRARPLANASAPFIAVPTTAGTGAEVTRNAVLASNEHRVKVSLRSPQMLPKIALVDPLLTHGLPPATTAATGLDALTQLIEPYVCRRANPMTDALCEQGMRRAARSLRRAVQPGDDVGAREDMAMASLFGGLALANAGLGAVHGFAGPIGGMFPAPHGAVCAALLPHVMRANLQSLRGRAAESEAIPRYREVARALTGRHEAQAEEGIAWVEALCEDLRIPPLREYGIGTGDFDVLCEKAARASSMKANPIELSREELGHLLERAVG